MRPQDIKNIFISESGIEKIAAKQHVSEEEVYETFENPDAHIKKIRQSPKVKNAYLALGRTWAGRYLTIPFYRKSEGLIHIGSARDMTSNERRLYEMS